MALTLIQLIDRQRGALAAKLATRQTHTDAIAAVRSAAESEGMRALTPAETVIVTDATAARSALDAEISAMNARIGELDAERVADEAATRLAGEVSPTGVQRDGTAREVGGAQIVGEPHTYDAGTARDGRSFFADAFRARFLSDYSAQERLQRHAAEVRVDMAKTHVRALATSGAGGLVIPQYLPEKVALTLRNGRPVANLIGSEELPAEGMSITIPRITTGVQVAPQNGQNTAIVGGDAAVTNVVADVVTAAGYTDISRQLLERGSGVDSILFQDMAGAYASDLDRQVIAGSGTGGNALGILATANISAATLYGAVLSVGNFYSKIGGVIAAIAGLGAGCSVNLIAMHPRRWGWLTTQVDSTGRPICVPLPNGPYNATALNLAPGKSGSDDDVLKGATIVGTIHGIPVTTDANIPTNVGTLNEDNVLVLDTTKLVLWEEGDGAPRQLKFEEIVGTNLTVRLVAYGYFAFTAGRYPAASGKTGGLDVTAGYGQIAPAF